MATKIYCDGCDQQIRSDQRVGFKFTIGINNESLRDLCERCIKKVDPMTWERPIQPAPRP